MRNCASSSRRKSSGYKQPEQALSNSATLSVIFGRDLLKKEARDERLAHMVALVLAALTGKSTADFGKPAFPGVRPPAHQPV